MDQNTGNSKKILSVSFLWGAMLFTHMIRYALAVAAPALMHMYHLSPKAMGYVLSGWNWSYTPALLFMGPIVDRFGPWIVMGIGSVIWGLSTIALPLASAAASLFLFRMIFGLGHSMLFPAIATSVSRDFGARERTRAIAVAHSGNPLGLAIGATVSAFLLTRIGWQAVFYCMGAASLLWTLSWFFFYPDRQVGRISVAGSHHSTNVLRIPWLSLFRFRSTWGISLGTMGYLYGYYFFVSWLPGYLVLDRKMTLLRSGIVAAFPFWIGVVCTLAGGWLGDYLIQRGVKPMVSRKSIIGVGLVAATGFVIAAIYVKQSWLAVTLLSLCVACLRLATASVNSLPIDLAPRSMVGSLTAIQNLFGNIAGMMAPIVTGYLVNATGSFVGSFIVAGCMALFGAICFVFVIGNTDNREIRGGLAAADIQTAPARAT